MRNMRSATARRIWIVAAVALCVTPHVWVQAVACEPPTFEVDVFAAALSPDGSSSVVLSFDDPNPAGAVTGYNIYRSPSPSSPLGSWVLLASGVGDENAAEPGIQWSDTSGETPATGIWFYVATALNEPCAQEGPWKSLRVSDTEDAVDLLPGDGACRTADGRCTLRAAVQESNALDGKETISLGAAGYALTLDGAGEDGSASGDLDLAAPAILRGQGATSTVIDALGADRVLHVLPGADVRVEHLTLQGGTADRGGGLWVESTAEAALFAVAVNENHSESDGGGIALDVDAQLTLEHSTLSYNLADGSGGGLAADGLATVVNCTLGWNAAGGIDDGSGAASPAGIGAGDGGAIFVGPDGVVSLLHATLSDNRAALGGAVANSGSVEMRNTVVADSSGVDNCDGPVDSLGHNLSSDSSCDLVSPGDLQDVDPDLGPLQVYGGGETGTYPPLEDSPVIGSGEECLPVDQVFAQRSFCCIGAVEVDPGLFTLPSGDVYVGDHPWEKNTTGKDVSIVHAPTNQDIGHLLIPDILEMEAQPNGKKIFMLQATNYNTPVTQDGYIVYDALQNVSTGVFFGPDLRDLAVRPGGGRVIVTDADTREARIFSTSTNQQIATIPFQWSPQSVAVHPQGWKAYVTLITGKVEVVRLDTYTVISEFQAGPQPVDVVFHPNGNRAYVLNHYGVSVTVTDGFDQVLTTIDLGNPLGTPYDHHGAIAIDPDGEFVYVADGQYAGGVAVISTATDQVVDTILTMGRRVKVHPLGNRLYVGGCGGWAGFKVITLPGRAILSEQWLRGNPCGMAILP